MNNEGNLKFRDRKAWAQFLLIMFALLALTIWGISGCCEHNAKVRALHEDWQRQRETPMPSMQEWDKKRGLI